MMEDQRLEVLFATAFDHLDVIYTLVHSNMTAAMQAELDAAIRELAMMREVMDIKHSIGESSTPDSREAVNLTEARIAELRATLRDRIEAEAGLAVSKQQRQALVDDRVIAEDA